MASDVSKFAPVFTCPDIDPSLEVEMAYFKTSFDMPEAFDKPVKRKLADSVFETMESRTALGRIVRWVDGRTWIANPESREIKRIEDFEARSPQELAMKLSLAGFTS